tara:strand:+ start:4200 stop:4571 length:372 start_codon:yes stop_codon:yes gene_type:complete
MKPLSKDLLQWLEDDSDVGSDDVSRTHAQQSLLLSEPDMNEIQIKVNNKLKLSQMEQVKHMFYIQRDVCHKDFMENYIPRFGALIWTLRHEENWIIDKERCEDETHNHQSAQYKYVFSGIKNA